MRQLYLKRLLVLFYAAAVYALAAPPVAEGRHAPPLPQHGDRVVQCKGRKGMETNRRELEEAIEKYRQGESVSLGMFYCREAFPTLSKYALDPDPKVRDRMAFFLRLYYTPAALQLLVRQIETYPADPNAFPAAYAAKYPCYFFRQVKAPSLAQALAAKIKSREDSFKRDEVYLMGCLATRDTRARSLLEEMSRPSVLPKLDEQERAAFSEAVDYARAEAGVKEAEERVLADIDRQSQDPKEIEHVLDDLKQFTNCHILRRYAQFIRDKRAWHEEQKISDFDDPRYKTENGLVLIRIADSAILSFVSVYGKDLVGVQRRDFREARQFTDAEIEGAYRHVTKLLEDRKYSTCRSSN